MNETENIVPDGSPEPQMNRAQRRAQKKAGKRKPLPKDSPRHIIAAFDTLARNHDQQISAAKRGVLIAQFRKPMDGEQLQQLGYAFRMAFERIAKLGTGDEEDWNTIVCTLNIAMVLCERGFGPEYDALTKEALDGAFRAKLRHGKSGKWEFDEPGMQAIADALDVHESQIDLATQAEIMSALGEVHRRIDSGDVYREAA